MTTDKPTSEGIGEMLARVDLRGHRLGLQLYPDKDHSALIGAIVAQGATVDAVLPYVYDAEAAETNIITAIDEMAKGTIDAIALTSSGQVRRLIEVAQAHGCEARLREGLTRTPIASVGPVVSDELKSLGLRTDIYPANDAYFMKPLIRRWRMNWERRRCATRRNIINATSFRDAPIGEGPESIRPVVVKDSGLALRATRNDESKSPYRCSLKYA